MSHIAAIILVVVWASGFCIVLGVALTVLRFVLQLRRKSKRSGEGFADFLSSMQDKGVPADVLEAVYTYFLESTYLRVPVRADDDLEGVYGLADEDLDDAAQDICRMCGRIAHDEGEPRSVSDLALLISRCPPADFG